MVQKIRLKDIAQRLGVSTVTVSKALSGQKGVSEENRKIIADLAEEMGYRPPNRCEGNQRVQYHLGLLTADTFIHKENSFYGTILGHLKQEIRHMRCTMELELLWEEKDTKLQKPKVLKSPDIDGIIVIGPIHEEHLELFQEHSHVPVMYLDFAVGSRNRDAVISDGFYGAAQLTEYLIQKGHKRIAFVGKPLQTSSVTDRYLGYQKVMMEHGIKIRPEWIIPDRASIKENPDNERFFPIPDPLPDAFFCNNDVAAALLYRKLRRMGIRVPEDTSIVGFDNFLDEGMMDLPLTTYEVDLKEMARKAVRNLIHKLNGEYYKRGLVITSGRIIERKSVQVHEQSHHQQRKPESTEELF